LSIQDRNVSAGVCSRDDEHIGCRRLGVEQLRSVSNGISSLGQIEPPQPPLPNFRTEPERCRRDLMIQMLVRAEILA
jgi:hypothetical protein